MAQKTLTLKQKEEASTMLDDVKNVKSFFNKEGRDFINNLESRRKSWGSPPTVEEFQQLKSMTNTAQNEIEWTKTAKDFSNQRRMTNSHFNKIKDTIKELNLSGDDNISVRIAKNLRVVGKKNLYQYSADELKEMRDEMVKERKLVNSKNKRNKYIVETALAKEWESFLKDYIPFEELLERLAHTKHTLKKLGFSSDLIEEMNHKLLEQYKEYTPIGAIFGSKLEIE